MGSETSPDEGAVGGGGGGTLEPVLPAVDSGRGSEFIAADGEMRLVKMAAGDGAVVVVLLLLCPPAETGVAGPPPALAWDIDCGPLGAALLGTAPPEDPGGMLGEEPVGPS